MKEVNEVIEELLFYGKKHLDLNDLDEVYLRNLLLHRLNCSEPFMGKIDEDKISSLTVADSLIEDLNEAIKSRDGEVSPLLNVEILGLLTPMPSFVADKVNRLEKEEHGKGLDYLFNLEIANNYIQKTAIDKNIYFKKDFGDNFVEVTINLSKPEKKNSDIAKLLTKEVKEKYPKCLLCLENLGYSGRSDHPARGNIRIVPMTLNNEKWFLQYSPYAYFDHHAIVINYSHHNMVINHDTFKKLLEFVNLYPTFFVGSNADLPIVGGSILNHEHYQGGLHLLPVFYSKDRKVYYKDKDIKISLLNWYNTVIRIESENLDKVVEAASKIFDTWKDYDDETCDILSHTGETRHSTITPIARKIGNLYQLNLILRNNRTSEKYPDGIFHAHPEYFHIKQEGIGLIEAMGLFILPPRLKREMGYVEEALTSDNSLESFLEKYPDLVKHADMVKELRAKAQKKLSTVEAKEYIDEYLAETCRNILMNTAVFKDDENGRAGIDRFMKKVGE